MENGFIYLIKASGLIGLFYFAYFLLLRKETFFSANRWFLLFGLVTSSVLPLFFITKIIWVEPTTDSFDWSNIPVTTSVIVPEPQIDWYLILAYVYFIGIAISLLKLVFDFNSLIQLLKGKTIQQQGNFKLIDLAENIAPFSFFNYIVYNSSLYSTTELENILEHEKVHSQQKHSIDILISRLFCVIFWFNPLVWLYKKAIAQNLEFIADSEAAKKITDKKAYQLTLLKITTQENCVALTNHFYQSLIKKRIIMLNQNQSQKWNSWKYALVLPALVAFVFLFQIEVVAQEKTISKEENKNDTQFPTPPPVPTVEKSNETAPPPPPKPAEISDKDIYIDGVKSTTEEFNKLDKSKIDKIDVNANENTVRITTKTTTEEKPLIVVNGMLMKPGFDVKTIAPSTITNTEVLKGIKATGNYGIDHPYVITINTSDENYTPKTNLEKAYVIIDGKEADYETFFNLRGKVKNISMNFYNYENTSKANKSYILREYGLKGKNGVLVVKTTPFDKEEIKEVNGWKISSAPIKEGIIKDVANQNKINYSNAIVIINGKIINYAKEFHLLNPDKIASIKIQKFSNASQKEKDEAVQKYGEKALNGIVEVETK